MNDFKFGCLVLCVAIAYTSWLLYGQDKDLDAGQPDPPQMTGRAPRFPGSPEAGVQSSNGQVDQADPLGNDPNRGSKTDPGAPSEARDAGSTPALAASTLAQYEDSFLATEEGLFDMTVSLWSTPEFLALTQDEAHELLALDDTMGLRGPETMLSIVGPLPDRDACRIAFASQAVQDALWDVVKLEVLLVELGEIPPERRPRWARRRLEEAISMRDAAMLDLMELCEKETGIPTWRIWWRAYRGWTEGMVPSENK